MVAIRLVTSLFVVALLAGCTAGGEPPRPGPSARPPETATADAGLRAAHTATVLPDGRVLVTGGCVTDGCTEATDRTAIVPADGGEASEGPDMAVARTNHTADLLPDGRVLVAGGFIGEGEGVTASVEVFDPERDAFTALPPLGEPRGGHGAATLEDGRVLLVGGWVGPGTYTATAEVVDPARGTVSPAAPLPYAADAIDAVRLTDGRVLVTGGQAQRGRATAEAALFDPATGGWTSTAPMSTPRMKHDLVALGDGRALVLGGASDDDTPLATTELFDPATGRFTPGPDLAEPRYKLPGGAAALDDGRVLVAGGGSTTEVLDLIAGTTVVVDAGSRRASFATLSLLHGGDALVVGGYDEEIRLLDQARTIRVPDA